MSKIIENIPTHLFLGFLGVGKTSAILSCFKQKPTHEHWVVLVNEFGPQGIDGSIYQNNGIQVKEVAGGCLCCVAGVPFQVAVTDILKQQKPDRLFIETSGASHTQGVLKTLQQDSFKQALNLKATVCIIDPNHFIDKRYFNNVNYQAQINTADVIVANKIDNANDQALIKLDAFIKSKKPTIPILIKTNFGNFDLACLDAPIIDKNSKTVSFFSVEDNPLSLKTLDWQFNQNTCFNKSQLLQWLQNPLFVRAKGIIKTSEHWIIINTINGLTQTTAIEPQKQNRIEIIIDSNKKFSTETMFKRLKECKIASVNS